MDHWAKEESQPRQKAQLKDKKQEGGGYWAVGKKMQQMTLSTTKLDVATPSFSSINFIIANVRLVLGNVLCLI